MAIAVRDVPSSDCEFHHCRMGRVKAGDFVRASSKTAWRKVVAVSEYRRGMVRVEYGDALSLWERFGLYRADFRVHVAGV